MKKSQHSKGFTLIELLVVISIIGVLATIVLASLNSARQKAKIVKAKAEVSVLYQSLTRYRIDNGNYDALPFSNCGGINNICELAQWNSGWLLPYISQPISADPWNTSYFWDGRPEKGYGECTPYQSAICSAGPNGLFESWNSPGPLSDDICVYFEPEC